MDHKKQHDNHLHDMFYLYLIVFANNCLSFFKYRNKEPDASATPALVVELDNFELISAIN